jgi:hypothetical protein
LGLLLINYFVEFKGIIGIPTTTIFVFNVHFDFPTVLKSMDFNFLQLVVESRRDGVRALELRELNRICNASALTNGGIRNGQLPKCEEIQNPNSIIKTWRYFFHYTLHIAQCLVLFGTLQLATFRLRI